MGLILMEPTANVPSLVSLSAPDANDDALARARASSGRAPKITPPPGEGDDPEACARGQAADVTD